MDSIATFEKNFAKFLSPPTRAGPDEHDNPAQYVSVTPATCGGLYRFGEAWAALRAENLLTYEHDNPNRMRYKRKPTA